MKNKQNILVAALISIPIVIFGALIWFSWGYRSGTEFSPDSFTRRTFTYNQDPVFGVVLVKKEYDDVTTPIELELIQDKWIQPVFRKDQRWHLIQDGQLDQQPSEADARFLTDMLDLRTDDYEFFWTVWNNDYPKLAKVFWPVVAEMARDDMYLVIPDVMEFARSNKNQDLADFQQRLDAIKARSYRQLGKLDFDLGRFERAKERLEKANLISPDPELQQWIKQCENQLGSQPSSASESNTESDSGTAE